MYREKADQELDTAIPPAHHCEGSYEVQRGNSQCPELRLHIPGKIQRTSSDRLLVHGMIFTAFAYLVWTSCVADYSTTVSSVSYAKCGVYPPCFANTRYSLGTTHRSKHYGIPEAPSCTMKRFVDMRCEWESTSAYRGCKWRRTSSDSVGKSASFQDYIPNHPKYRLQPMQHELDAVVVVTAAINHPEMTTTRLWEHTHSYRYNIETTKVPMQQSRHHITSLFVKGVTAVSSPVNGAG